MRQAWSHGFVGAVAFVLGAVLTGVVLITPNDADPIATNEEARPETTPSRGGPDAPAEALRRVRSHAAPGEPSVDASATSREGGITEDSLGTPATAAELEFLRTALAAERARVAQLAEDAAEQARAARFQSDDDGLTVLDRYLRHGSDVDDVVGSFAAMRAHINTVQEPVHRFEPTGKRTTVDLSEVSADDAVLEFGAGVFVLERGDLAWNVRREDVESLEIRGAGMDKTTLVGPGWAFLSASKGAQIRNLVIRDLTIDSQEIEQMTLDARGGISAALERVRFAGWVVAGHAAALGVSGDAFLAARDCEFNGDGWTLSLRGPGLAVFERCTFSGGRSVLIADAHRKGRPAVVRLNDCAFGSVRIADRSLRTREAGGADVEIRGGTAAAGPASWSEETRIKNFGAEDVVSMKGLTFVTAPPAFSVEDAAVAFGVAATSGLRNLVGVRVVGLGNKPTELDFYVIDGEPGSAPVRRTRIYDGASLTSPVEEPRRGAHGGSAVDPADLERAQPFSRLLRNAGVAADESVVSVMLRATPIRSDDPDVRAMLMLIIELDGPGQVIVDAVTGDVIGGR